MARFTVRVPPLRAQGEDIGFLANHFLQRFAMVERTKIYRRLDPIQQPTPPGCSAPS